MLLAAIVLANIPLYLLVGWVTFNDVEGAVEAFGNLFRQITRRGDVEDLQELIDENYEPPDTFQSLKAVWFIFICFILVFIEYKILVWAFPPG